MMKLTPFQWSSFNFFGFYCAFGVLLPFLPVWLQYHGYDTEQIGLLIALGYLFRFMGAMFFSRRVNNPNQLIPLNRFLTWATVGVVLLMIWSVPSIWIFLPVIAFFHIFNGGSMPIADTIASTWHQQIGLDYGRTRLFGSMAFVVGSISTGYLVGWLGQNAIIGILMGWLVFLGIGISFNPTQKFKFVEKSLHNNDCDEMGYWQLLRAPTTLRMLIAISLIQASHAVYYAYSTLYWTSNGISTESTSLLWGVAVASEIMFFFFANKLFKAWRTHFLIILSTLGTVIRWSLLASTNSFTILVLAQLLHAISYGMGHYAMIRYIATQPIIYTAKLQALYFSIASCVIMALFTFIAGQVYQFSPVWSFGLMAILAFPALFIVPRRFESRIGIKTNAI